jgi:membrane-bound inhibitor of C-type lysozyme
MITAAMLAAALLAAPTMAAAAPATGAAYVCEGGAIVRVAYVNAPDGDAFAVVDWGGRLIPMRAMPAASGVWYVAFDEQDGHRWRTKGDEAFLARLAPDHTATEQVVLGGCRTVK